MGKGVKLSDAELQKLTSQVDSTCAQMNSYVKNLETLVSSLGPAWRGSAATSFSQAQRQLNSDQQKLVTVLRGIQASIERTKKSHGSNDAEIAAGMRSAGAGSDAAGTRDAGGGIAGL